MLSVVMLNVIALATVAVLSLTPWAKLSNCDIELGSKVLFSNETKWYKIGGRQKS
jgi:hypothetical protein